MLPNLRRLNLDARIDLQSLGRRHRATVLLPGRFCPFFQDQAQRYSDRLNLDSTILRENTNVVITVWCRLHDTMFSFSIEFVVQRPISHLLL